jgi:hypothetical protein
MQTAASIRRLWTGAAVICFNTVIVFLVLNTASLLWLRRVNGRAAELPRGAIDRRSGATLQPVHPDLTEPEISDLIRETWSRNHAYEPFTGHREREFEGRWVNVDEHGFRHGSHGPSWPPPPGSVFVFGGSTTFGMGVPDGGTIPAQLEQKLRDASGRDVHVYNFGRGYYFSSQERALFTTLLEQGIAPAIAVLWIIADLVAVIL